MWAACSGSPRSLPSWLPSDSCLAAGAPVRPPSAPPSSRRLAFSCLARRGPPTAHSAELAGRLAGGQTAGGGGQKLALGTYRRARGQIPSLALGEARFGRIRARNPTPFRGARERLSAAEGSAELDGSVTSSAPPAAILQARMLIARRRRRRLSESSRRQDKRLMPAAAS